MEEAKPAHTPKPKEEDPDKTLAIIAMAGFFVLPIPPLALILAIIAHYQSKKRGYINTLATVGIWIYGIFTALLLLALPLIVWAAVQSDSNYQEKRYEQGWEDQNYWRDAETN